MTVQNIIVESARLFILCIMCVNGIKIQHHVPKLEYVDVQQCNL